MEFISAAIAVIVLLISVFGCVVIYFLELIKNVLEDIKKELNEN